MRVRDTRSSSSRREPRRAPLLVRRPGQRCDFCGNLTSTAAVFPGDPASDAVICPRCVERAAQQLTRPGGGDAA